MATWIQSLSWTLIYSLGQGFVIYASLWLVLKMLPSASANVKYHLSLSALTILLTWFGVTWWQQYHAIVLVNEQMTLYKAQHAASFQQQLAAMRTLEGFSNYRMVLASVQVLSPWLTAFYVTGLIFMLVRLSAGMLQLISYRKTGISKPEAGVEELLKALKNRLHFEGAVELFISAKAQVPMVIGFLKPVILMPAAIMAQLSTEQLETILLHELAHIKRYDYLVNILQSVVETILFFNPFVWLVSAITRREREHCCDDLVLDHTREPLFYATALAVMASQPAAVSDLTVAASGNSNLLFNRIKRIMEMKKNPFSYSRMVAAILIIAAISCSAFWLTPAFAENKKSKPDKVAVEHSKPVAKPPVNNNDAGENQLVQALLNDHLVDEVKGFVVERKQNSLYINGQEQSATVSAKYLKPIKQEYIRVQVFSFMQRLQMHPQSGLLELIAPVSTSSGCVDKTPKKGDGC